MTLNLLINGHTLRVTQPEPYVMSDADADRMVLKAVIHCPDATRPSGLAPVRRQRLVLYRDTLQDLERKASLQKEQVTAGREIGTVYQLLMGGSSVGVGSYAGVVELPNGETVPARYGVAVVERYLPWKAWAQASWINRARTKTMFDLSVLVCVDGLGKRQAADRLGMDHRTTLRQLQESLWRYALIAGWVHEIGDCPSEAA